MCFKFVIFVFFLIKFPNCNLLCRVKIKLLIIIIISIFTGTASLARGLSDYIDALANNTISETLTDRFPINVPFLSKYPDFLSLIFVLLLTGNRKFPLNMFHILYINFIKYTIYT